LKRAKQETDIHFIQKLLKKEGFPEIAKRLRAIAIAEKHHKERYKRILSKLQNNTLFKKGKKVY